MAPGPYVPLGSQVTFSYTVTNPSNVHLLNVVVLDDNGRSIGNSLAKQQCAQASLKFLVNKSIDGSALFANNKSFCFDHMYDT